MTADIKMQKAVRETARLCFSKVRLITGLFTIYMII